ncbi:MULTISPECIES: exodeoxyribonuclease VII small subunit [Spiroplasma]|uniref:exodeoxyribonuclease VII small subunit n=1 Tax=Spiroplasma TaxID=2132 RepID=UPI0018DCCE2D|nr:MULTISPECIES: exodeoxyribonuclease VII small subunit [Spiroplasma]MBH8622823.1 exodeoxyribonuclease VII small subunit [Spiroplasma sp. hyd1]UNF62137.1 exodeoxyribonuclease VII small subunit [Spiroplasma poulsonii]
MADNKSFEQVLEQLKQIVNDLENNQLPLDQAIDAFETEIKLTKLAETKLQDIKDKVTKIVKNNNPTDFKVDEE